MNPLSALNTDLATLKLATEKVFASWNDKVADGFKNQCVNKIQSDWKRYMDEMNVRMNIYVRAEKRMNEVIERYEQKYNRR